MMLASRPLFGSDSLPRTTPSFTLPRHQVDLLATREDERGQGHARALVSGLEGAAAALGIQALVVVLDRSDRDAR